MGVDPVSGRLERQYPRWKTNVKIYCGFVIVVLCLLVAFWIMLVAFWAEEMLVDSKKIYGSRMAAFFTALPSMIYAALVWIMNFYYRKLATFLTEWENHRTQTQFDKARVTKLVLFEFVNNFMSLFYIAFYINDFEMLRSQLMVMLIILQAINHFQEALLPLVIRRAYAKLSEKVTDLLNEYPWTKSWVQSNSHPTLATSSNGTVGGTITGCLHVPQLDQNDPRIAQTQEQGKRDPYEGTFDDYLEMFIQFGYVFLFSSVFPIAAFCAIINNVIEIRTDAFKLCHIFQRPLAKQVKDMGVWQPAFEIIGVIAVMTNCALLGMSPQLRSLAPKLSLVEWVLVLVTVEHIILTVKFALVHLIPDEPEWVKIARAKFEYESKEALKKERMTRTRRQLSRRFRKTIHFSTSPNPVTRRKSSGKAE